MSRDIAIGRDRAVAGAVPVDRIVLAVSLAIFVVGIVLRLGHQTGSTSEPTPLSGPVGLVAFAVPGSFLIAHARTRRVGWGAIAIGGLLGFSSLALEYARYGGVAEIFPGVDGARIIGQILPAPAIAAIPGLLLILPEGRLPSGRWRPALGLSALAILTTAASAAVAAVSSRRTGPVLLPGLGDLQGWARPLDGLTLVALVSSVFFGVTSLMVRLLDAGGVERLQLRAIAFGAAISGLLLSLAPATTMRARDVLVSLALVPLPASLGFAHVRHRLWTVDLVINRAIVFGGLAAGVIGVTALVVAVFGSALGDRTGAPLLSIAVLALVVQPAHHHLQRAVNRLFYGDAREPSAAIAAVVRDLAAARDPRESLRAAAVTVARALRLPYVGIETDEGATVAVGTPAGGPVRLPLVHAGARSGWLEVSPRRGQTSLPPGDLRLLESLAGQIAVVAHAASLTVDLQRSRERLVTAREEERRRLRRDLHDELGPALAAVALQLESLRARVGDESVGVVLDRCDASLRVCVRDVRRIVDDLGPADLDELGLEDALTEQAMRFRTPDLALHVSISLEREALPAAVEVAAYRIASEAIGNAVRHGNPGHVWVEVQERVDRLHVCVRDDGGGSARATDRGVGLRSMRERAEELGGTLDVSSTPHGVDIRAQLPLGTARGVPGGPDRG